MQIFIDESGDIGRKLDKNSSPYFIVSLVVFAEDAEAEACSERIDLLRRELHLTSDFEFHFAHNSNRQRSAFLEAVAKINFTYFIVVIDKNRLDSQEAIFENKQSFYEYTCNMVFTNARPHLVQSTVALDKSGSADFRHKLRKYLTSGNGESVIKKLKQQDSSATNLLQLADYVSGVINRKIQDKKGWQAFYQLVRMREMSVEIWPK